VPPLAVGNTPDTPEVSGNPVTLVATNAAGVPNPVALPDASRLTDLPAGYVQNTSLVPAEKVTKLPLLLEANTVSRESVVPEEVYVPMPTSHSEEVCPAIV
jgi:hypothetical protein